MGDLSADKPAAWREFHDRYGELIYRFAERQNVESSRLDDVVQDVLTALVKAMRGGFRYDPAKGKFRSYLKTVVARVIRRGIRQIPGRTVLGTYGEEVEAPDPELERLWEDEWRQYHLRRAMPTIEVEFSPQDVAAFKRYTREGQDAAKTAASVGLSRDQVYRSKSLILKRLRELIRQQVTEEG